LSLVQNGHVDNATGFPRSFGSFSARPRKTAEKQKSVKPRQIKYCLHESEDCSTSTSSMRIFYGFLISQYFCFYGFIVKVHPDCIYTHEKNILKPFLGRRSIVSRMIWTIQWNSEIRTNSTCTCPMFRIAHNVQTSCWYKKKKKFASLKTIQSKM